VSFVLIAVGLITLAILFISNVLREGAAEEQLVLREFVRSLESNLRVQSGALVVVGGLMVTVSSRGGQRALNNLASRARLAVRSDYAAPVGGLVAVLLAGLLIFA
jgi:hypothetical protein